MSALGWTTNKFSSGLWLASGSRNERVYSNTVHGISKAFFHSLRPLLALMLAEVCLLITSLFMAY